MSHVVTLCLGADAHDNEHERATRELLARRLAVLRSLEFGGEYAPDQHAPPLYYVPNDTLVTHELVRFPGIEHRDQLYGGVVPHRFVATKVISHPLVSEAAVHPVGWTHCMAQRLQGLVLQGYSAFSHDDAMQAARTLLAADKPVRLKRASARGGQGQWQARDLQAFGRALESISAAELAEWGVVIEENLEQTRTWSVGQVTVGGRSISYHGTQRTTRDNKGCDVYGGSDLHVVRGGFAELLALPLSIEVADAVRMAMGYHQAVVNCFEGFFASRINYDVVQGLRADGTRKTGVLEQSWRLGGASAAEVAALEYLAAHADCAAVRACTNERYGADALNGSLPEDALVCFKGVDPVTGPIVKYATAHCET